MPLVSAALHLTARNIVAFTPTPLKIGHSLQSEKIGRQRLGDSFIAHATVVDRDQDREASSPLLPPEATPMGSIVKEMAVTAEEILHTAIVDSNSIHIADHVPLSHINDSHLKDFSHAPRTGDVAHIQSKSTGALAKESFVIPRDQIPAILKFGVDGEEKIINIWGLYCFAVTLVTCPLWMATMSALSTLHNMFENFDPQRALYDRTGKIWSRVWLQMLNSYPTITGDVDSIRNDGLGPVLFVANHASWLDIPVLCCVLDPVFKFIAKGELKGVPAIGQQLIGGEHILIDRDDRKSQLRTFKEGLNWLNNGVSIMAFPEGARSKDGRLMNFKGGTFSMAVKAKVPIVPLTISNAHAVMPGYALFPVQNGAGKLALHVHPAIYPEEGMTDVDLSEQVRKAIISKLPNDQKPIKMSE